MNTIAYQFLVFAVAIGLPASALAQDLTGQWELKIENKKHLAVATLAVEFTQQKALSCIGGDWLRLNIISASTTDSDFYPLKDPMSYQLVKNELTIGRNGVCDGYLHMSGTLDGQSARGDYYSFGLSGSTPLGFFELQRKNR